MTPATLIGSSDAMQRLRALIAQIAWSAIWVFLDGPTGAGKSLVARAIHEASPRAGRPFIRVDCGAIADSLIDVELSGCVRGAFTDAKHDRIGMFEAADGGTLFLDELAELPLHSQTRLLTVLEEQEIRPVGAIRTKRVDVRVIAATNRDLRAELLAGRFREDLYYRVAGIVVRVPGLGERREEIPSLISHIAESRGLSVPLTPDALNLMKSAEWRGNVRQLQKFVERLAALYSGATIDAEKLLGATRDDPCPPTFATRLARCDLCVREVLSMGLPDGESACLLNVCSTRIRQIKKLGVRRVRRCITHAQIAA
ncbi:MAG: sigma-54-dependent Fis family transcriptional regulator [Deltaproteobacteria bacterium]|nr:sigma-54-dependent Fis family transcriptional regulator [Deltaproteobacteria bacterium]